MKDFMQVQIEASERLYQMMLNDHKERVKDMVVWSETSVSLMNKLKQRDEEIIKLRAEILILKAGK
jgi:hypothetical protein